MQTDTPLNRALQAVANFFNLATIILFIGSIAWTVDVIMN